MADTRDLLVRIKGDSSDFEKSMNKVKGSSDSAGLSFGKLTGAVALGNVVANVAEKGFEFLGSQLMSTIKSANESENAVSQLNAVLNSTGGAAGITSKQLQNQATALQKLTTFSDEAVMSAQSLLLTFTNVKGQVFQDSIPLILDMSQALGQDLKSSSIQLGKALNDPITGITALKRVGVSFNETQKDMIAKMVQAGNVAGAQQVILAELRKEFGGSAEAAGKTFAGSLARLKNQLDDMKESIGGAIIRGITPFTQSLANFVSSDKFQVWLQSTITLIGRLIGIMTGIIKSVEEFADKTANYLRPQLEQLGKVIQSDLWPALQRLWKEAIEPLAKIALPILVEAIKLLIEYLILWSKALAFVIDKTLDFAKWIEAVPGRIKAAWNDLADWFKAKWDDVVSVFTGAKKSIEDRWNDLTKVFTDGKDKVKGAFNEMKEALKPWKEDFGGTFVKTMRGIADAMEQYDLETLAKWKNWIDKTLTSVKDWGGNLYDSVSKSVSEAFNSTVDYMNGLPERFTQWLSATGIAIKNWANETYHNITQSFKDAFDNIGKTLQELPGKIWEGLIHLKDTIANFFNGLGDSLKEWVNNSGKQIASHHTDGMKAHFASMETIRKVGDSIIGMILLVMATVAIYFVDAGIRLTRSLVSGIVQGIGAALGAVASVGSALVGKISQYGNDFYNAGRNLISGFINGIKDMMGAVGNAVSNVGSSAVNKMKSVLGIHSPSKVFTEIGQNLGEGLINGLSSTANDVKSAVNDLAQASVAAPANDSTAPAVSMLTAQAAPAAPQQNVTIHVAPEIGMYAGLPAERREIAVAIWQDLVKMARAQGVQLPNINVAGIQ